MGIRLVRKFKSAKYIIYSVEHQLRFRAKPRFGVYPISFRWYLDGTLMEGKGNIAVGESKVSYEVDRNRCKLRSETGRSLSTELCLISVDARGQECRSCVPLDLKGELKRGGRLEGKRESAKLELLARLGGKVPIKFPLSRHREPVKKLYDPRKEFRRALAKGMGIEVKEEEFA